MTYKYKLVVDNGKFVVYSNLQTELEKLARKLMDFNAVITEQTD